MDVHEDDISILPDTEEDQITISEDGSGLSPFRLTSVDIPASTHALQTAYRDLKKRYNESEQRYRALRRHTRENSTQRMAFDNSFLSGENCPPFGAGMGEQGAAAMADQSVEDQAKQGLINHLTRQITVAETKYSILEAELKHTRQKLDEFRSKYGASSQERDRLKSELSSKSVECEEGKVRAAREVAELKVTIRNLNQEVNRLKEALNSKDDMVQSLQQQFERLVLSKSSEPSALPNEYPSSYPGQKGVVSVAEFQAVKERMKQCQESMETLKRVVDQQNELIRLLQADQLSKDSKDWDVVYTTDFTNPVETKDLSRLKNVHQNMASPTETSDLSVDQAFSPTNVKQADFPEVSGHLSEGLVSRSLRVQDVPVYPGKFDHSWENSKQFHFGREQTDTVYSAISPSSSQNQLADTARHQKIPVQGSDLGTDLSDVVRRPQPLENSFTYAEPHPPSRANRNDRSCPVCTVNFSHLTMADFQNHVFECYDNTESGEMTRAQNAMGNTGVQATETGEDNSGTRVCPVCLTDFHADIPQSVYERHVYEHFGEPPNIVDDFAILNPE
ncbi:uncharacterized protein LOC135472617 [Liolophura sinensis]|uniref:uncharacterized protein LOC135472617 n=1 Tax=Liolophura sinensis TaxID=3198878 RepID=UPI0031597688